MGDSHQLFLNLQAALLCEGPRVFSLLSFPFGEISSRGFSLDP